MEIYSILSLFDLTKQEAALYVHLLTYGGQTGYEAAKGTGISRSNAYMALATLVEKGAANTMDGTPVKFIAVPAEEFCRKRIAMLERAADELNDLLPKGIENCDGYVTIDGQANIMGRVESMILGAQQRVYLSAGAQYLPQFAEPLKALAESGKKVVIITDAPFELPGAAILVTSERGDQIRLITDSCRVLTGDFSGCLYSDKEHVVQVVKDSLRYELRLIRYGHDIMEE